MKGKTLAVVVSNQCSSVVPVPGPAVHPGLAPELAGCASKRIAVQGSRNNFSKCQGSRNNFSKCEGSRNNFSKCEGSSPEKRQPDHPAPARVAFKSAGHGEATMKRFSTIVLLAALLLAVSPIVVRAQEAAKASSVNDEALRL